MQVRTVSLVLLSLGLGCASASHGPRSTGSATPGVAANGEIHLPVPLRAADPDASAILVGAAKFGGIGVTAPVAILVTLGDDHPLAIASAISEALGFGKLDAIGCSGCVAGKPYTQLRVENAFVAGDSAWVDVTSIPVGVKSYCAPKDALCEVTPRSERPSYNAACITVVRSVGVWRKTTAVTHLRRTSKNPRPRCVP